MPHQNPISSRRGRGAARAIIGTLLITLALGSCATPPTLTATPFPIVRPSPTAQPSPTLSSPPPGSPTTTATAAATATPQVADAAPVVGQWVGGFTPAGELREESYLRVEFHLEGGALRGTLHFPLANRQWPLQAWVAGGQLSFASDDGAFRCAGQLQGTALRGEGVRQGQRAICELLQLGDQSRAAYSRVAGDYVSATGRYVALFINGQQLQYHDFATSRLGVLLPTAGGDYIAGPAFGLFYPVEDRVSITAAHDGQGGELVWRGPDGTETLRRLECFYTTEEVRFQNGDVTLAGTLVRPTAPGRHPALVNMHGSEPARRTDPYARQRAEWLAYHGFAVLLYDKRGVGDSTGTYQEYASDTNLNNLAGDGLAGVQLLKAHPAIDPLRIGLIGASQAGWIMPRVAGRSPDVAFVVALVGPTINEVQQNLWVALVRQRDQGSLRGDEEVLAQQVLAGGHGGFDARAYLEQLTVPTLWVFGGRDKQVPSRASMLVLADLVAAGHANHTVRFYPTGSHGLLDAVSGYPEEMSYLRGYVPGLEDLLLGWLSQQVGMP
jgi:dienelactone hydrolase